MSLADRLYIDTRIDSYLSFTEQIHLAENASDDLERYLKKRGCEDVHVPLTKYPGVIYASWYPKRCNTSDILEELKQFCKEHGYRYSLNLKDLIEGEQ